MKLKFLCAGHLHLAAEAQDGCKSAGFVPQACSEVWTVCGGYSHCRITATLAGDAPACASAGIYLMTTCKSLRLSASLCDIYLQPVLLEPNHKIPSGRTLKFKKARMLAERTFLYSPTPVPSPQKNCLWG